MIEETTLWVTVALIGALVTLKSSTSIKTFEGEPYEFGMSHYLLAGITSIAFSTMSLQGQSVIHPAILIVLSSLLSVQLTIDVKYKELANEWNLLIFIIALPTMFFYYGDKIWAYALTCLILFSLFFAVWFVTDSLGFGDVKMVGAFGWLLTLGDIYPFLIVALVSGSVFGLIDVVTSGDITKKETWKQELAFGPHLILAFVLVQSFPNLLR